MRNVNFSLYPHKGKIKVRKDFDHKAIKLGGHKAIKNTGVIKPHVYAPTALVKGVSTAPPPVVPLSLHIKNANQAATAMIKNKAVFKPSKKQAAQAKQAIQNQNKASNSFSGWWSNIKKAPLKLAIKILVPLVLLVMIVKWLKN